MPILERSSGYRLPEGSSAQIIGTGVIIVRSGLTRAGLHEILTVTEGRRKGVTGRRAGQQSIPLETMKVGEEPRDTLLGAMAEVMDPDGVATVGEQFHHIPGDGVAVPLDSLPGKAAGIEVVIFNGEKDSPFMPFAREEIHGVPKWSTPNAHLQNQNGRRVSQEIVTIAVAKGLIGRGLVRFSTGKAVPLFPEGYDMQAFHTEREKLPDILK